jgi:hypothetical protein
MLKQNTATRAHLEAWHNACASGHGDELNLHAAHPADGWQVVVVQQVVGFILKAPLADHQVSTCGW